MSPFEWWLGHHQHHTPNGGSFLAVDPAYQNGMLSQTLTSLVTGATYTVSFYAAAAQQQGVSLAGSGYSSINNTWSLLTYDRSNVLTCHHGRSDHQHQR